jgi:hypothetical protein
VRGRSPGRPGPFDRAALRGWLPSRFLSPALRGGMLQAALWLGLGALLLWGVLGLVAAPLY